MKIKMLRMLDCAILWAWLVFAIGLDLGLIVSMFNREVGVILIDIFGLCLIFWLVLGGWAIAGYFFEKLRYKVLCQNTTCKNCKTCEHYVGIWVKERCEWYLEKDCEFLYRYLEIEESRLVRPE